MSLINNLLIKSLTFIIKESYGKTKKKKKKMDVLNGLFLLW